MIEFENRIAIHKTADQLCQYVADPENYPAWNYFVTEVERISGTGVQEGARFHQVRKDDEQLLEISGHEPGRRVVVRTVPPSQPVLEREMEFVNHGATTEIIDRWNLDLGVPGILEGLAGRRVKQAVRQNLGKLKTLLEEGRVVLQDGRISKL